MGIDSFLQDLFPPTQLAGGNFDDRFRGIVGGGDPMPMSYAPTSAPNPLADVPAAAPNIPLPAPRPDVASILSGSAGGGGMGGGTGGGGLPPPVMTPPPDAVGTPSSPGGSPSIFSRLAGQLTGQPTAPAPTGDQQAKSILGRLAGLDVAGEKRARTALAGGFKDANPAFGGGAFMKGAGGSLAGGLLSDKADTDAATSAADKAQSQSNFERTQGDKELTSASLRKLYGDRGTALNNPALHVGAGGRKAWDKPATERWKDAQNLIINKNKEIDGSLNLLGMPKAERDKAAADARAAKDQFRKATLQQYGLNDDGSEAAPARAEVPSRAKVVGDREAVDRGLYEQPKGTYDSPHMPTTQEDFDALPSGAIFINPANGQPMAKRATQ